MLREPLTLLVSLPAKTAEVVRTGARVSAPGGEIERVVTHFRHVISALADDVSAMRDTTERLDNRVAAMQQQLRDADKRLVSIDSNVADLARTVDEVVDRLPDPEQGPVAKVKQVLSGNGGQ